MGNSNCKKNQLSLVHKKKARQIRNINDDRLLVLFSSAVLIVQFRPNLGSPLKRWNNIQTGSSSCISLECKLSLSPFYVCWKILAAVSNK